METTEKPTEERVLKIYKTVEATHTANEHQFYAALYKQVQDVFPFFSSRDVRNIQSAISLRLTDFDLPEDWYENPEIYFKKTYNTKLDMLRELMKANMKGLNFSDIRKQEVIRYLDNMAIIADTDFKRKVDSRIKQMNVEVAARKQFDI